jgi:hypothetical protein
MFEERGIQQRSHLLTLEDLGHDSERDRPCHYVYPGAKNDGVRTVLCGKVLTDARKTGGEKCVVCWEMYQKIRRDLYGV